MAVLKIKKQKSQKVFHKKKTWIWKWYNCLEETQLEDKIKHLEKNKINFDSL